MKRTVKILSVLLGFILAFTPILSLTVSADDAAYGVSSSYSADLDAASKKLAITEINAGNVDNTAYQYIEIANISDEEVKLSDYYLYRWNMHFKRGRQAAAFLKATLGLEESWHNMARISLGDCLEEDVTLKSGEVAVVWLNMNKANASSNSGWGRERVNGSEAAQNTLTVSDFKTSWSLGEDVKVANLEVMGTASTGDDTQDASTNASIGGMYRFYYTTDCQIDGLDYYNAGFLPLGPGMCILELMHKDVQFAVTNPGDQSTKTITPATDVNDFAIAFYSSGAFSNTDYAKCGIRATTTDSTDQTQTTDILCYDDNAKARYAAGECCAVWFTDVDPKTMTPTVSTEKISRHFYGFMDTDKYTAAAAQLSENGSTAGYVTSDLQNYSNFVTSKITETGEYGNGYGVGRYNDANDQGVESNVYYFADEGNIEESTPGVLNAGQFGYGLSAEGLGSQVKTAEDGKTYSVRFSATFEADALVAAKNIGFDIVATYEGGSKTISKNCSKVYKSIYGKGENGAELYTKEDLDNGHDYFFTVTVENISIDDYENIEFVVTPYVITQTGVKVSAASKTVTYDDGALVTNS